MLAKLATQLAKVASVDEAKDIRDKAEALAVYYRQQKHCREIERSATVIRLRAERRIGELLAKVHAGNPNCKPGGQLPKGITRNQSSQWQLTAKVPEAQFEKYLASCRPTTKGLVRLARENQRKRTRGPSVGCGVISGDMWQLHSRLKDDSVDLFLTDPPYSDVEAYGRLAELAAAKLRDGGLCLAYTGLYRLPDVLHLMGEHLKYHWVFSITRTSHNVNHTRNLASRWRPVVAFAKGKPSHDFVVDSFASSGKEKEFHEWQQPLKDFEFFIEKLTIKGDFVVDPFAGSAGQKGQNSFDPISVNSPRRGIA